MWCKWLRGVFQAFVFRFHLAFCSSLIKFDSSGKFTDESSRSKQRLNNRAGHHPDRECPPSIVLDRLFAGDETNNPLAAALGGE